MSPEDDNPDPESAPGANTPEISVSELAQALKRTVEDRFGRVRIRGEISNYRGPHSSGHAYFSLKDAGARLDAVVWKGTLTRLRQRPQEGLEVVATGRITTFPGKSSYQIVIESMEPAGVGALMAVLEARRQQFLAEGLFDAARKRPIPFLPRTIGVVTSPTGAVIRDILHRIVERFPRRVLVWPVRVQGETSAVEVAAAIRGFNALPIDGPVPRPDVLIVARGGGSLEDLWSFNEESTVRAVAASEIPLIAAIGHETDWTLVDFAADLRAPTPTGAAEKAVPVRAELREQLAGRARRLGAASTRTQAERRTRLAGLSRLLPQPDALLATPRQKLDRAGERLGAAIVRRYDARRLRLAQTATRLSRHAPQAELARVREKLDGLGKRLDLALTSRVALARRDNAGATQRLAAIATRLPRAFGAIVGSQREKLARLARLQESLSHKAVLARGFALARDEKGAIIRSTAQLRPGERIDVEVADGVFAARIDDDGTLPKKASARRREKPARPRGDQGALF